MRARREVIVSAGAIDSPQLLLLSGIGPADQLQQQSIPVVADLPGVGANLQDHLRVTLSFESITNWGPADGSMGAMSALFMHARPSSGTKSPNLQLYWNESTDRCWLWQSLGLPESRGKISLRSADPLAKPIIRANYLQRENDMRALVKGVEFIHDLVESASVAKMVGGELGEIRGRARARDKIRQEADTIFHPVGTCKMGADRAAVVDAQLRVRGVSGLRVADASIMPTITNGNTNAPSIMIGEKAADLIRREA